MHQYMYDVIPDGIRHILVHLFFSGDPNAPPAAVVNLAPSCVEPVVEICSPILTINLALILKVRGTLINAHV
jgi:hypothetical protein